MKITIKESDISHIDELQYLWEGLRDYHNTLSKRTGPVTFQDRAKQFREKSIDGKLYILVAHDEEEDRKIGYCISSIINTNEGEIDSLFILDEYRSHGIGDSFVIRTMEWFEQNHIKDIKIAVQYENEAVLGFYRKYDFFPRSIILKKG
jgi:ribosomal protein S18 acetylase RimI-like enzyme